jgi:hypothetical protein
MKTGTGKRIELVVDLDKRVFSTSPPMFTRPNLKRDISGFSTVPDLINKLSDNSTEAFPYERELALYLLLVASLWPGDDARLVTAARIFAGALNFHVSNVPPNRVFNEGDSEFVFHKEFQRAKIEVFNDVFFTKIGGPQSLLFSQSLEEFHHDLWKQVADLTMIHDVMEYLIKTSSLSGRLSSLTFAYHAIAHNIFSTEGGYGIPTGQKRRRGKSELVTTMESVRAKCKGVTKNVILSFIMTRWYGIHLLDPANPQFLVRLARQEILDSDLRFETSALARQLLAAKSPQNISLIRWARTDALPLEKPPRFYTLNSEELERAFTISDSVFKIPLSQDERDALRRKLQTWWQQIPSI